MMREAVLTSGRLIIRISIQAAAAGGPAGRHGGATSARSGVAGGLFLETEWGWRDGGVEDWRVGVFRGAEGVRALPPASEVCEQGRRETKEEEEEEARSPSSPGEPGSGWF